MSILADAINARIAERGAYMQVHVGFIDHILDLLGEVAPLIPDPRIALIARGVSVVGKAVESALEPAPPAPPAAAAAWPKPGWYWRPEGSDVAYSGPCASVDACNAAAGAAVGSIELQHVRAAGSGDYEPAPLAPVATDAITATHEAPAAVEPAPAPIAAEPAPIIEHAAPVADAPAIVPAE